MRIPLILVIDDNDLLRFAYRILLQKAGFRVADAPHGAAGLDRAHAMLPDLVLLDLSMPVLNGWQTMAALRGDPRTAEIPVIANTAESGRTLVDELRRAGFWGYASKDVGADELIGFVRSALAMAEAGGRWFGCANASAPPRAASHRGDPCGPSGGMHASG